MSQPKFSYKGVDISNLIITGTSSISGFTGFPNYSPATAYSYERPIPFGIQVNNVEVANQMNSKYIEYNTAQVTTYSLPASYDSIRAIIAGGGGGGGGRGGCGYDLQERQRTSGAYGNDGGDGIYTYLSNEINLVSSTINLKVGGGGEGGNNGGDADEKDSSSGGNGNSGDPGQESYIRITTTNGTYTVYANGGSGGSGGGGGNANTPDNNNEYNATKPGTSFTNNLSNVLSVNTVASIPSNLNPVNYLTNISAGGEKKSGGTPPTNGKPGYIRLYLLKS